MKSTSVKPGLDGQSVGFKDEEIPVLFPLLNLVNVASLSLVVPVLLDAKKRVSFSF